MKRNLIASVLFSIVLGLESVSGQDPNYTQFSNDLMYYNPAFTGLYKGLRARFAYRDQWPSLPYDFRAYHFDADLGDRSLPGSGGFGLFVNTDNEGIGFIHNLNVGLSVAVRIQSSNTSAVQVGIKASWLQKSVNWDDFVFTDALSERYGAVYPTGFIKPDRNTINMPDFGIGGIAQFGNESGSVSSTVGLAVDHLFEPDQSFLQTAKAPLPRKWVAHADLMFALGSTSGFGDMSPDATKINPGIIFQSQGKLNSFQAGLNLTKFNFNVGLWYKGAFGSYGNGICAFMAGYKYYFTDNIGLKFTYSYDMQITGALQGTGGAHEISLILDFNTESLFGEGTPSRSWGHSSGQGPWECPAFW